MLNSQSNSIRNKTVSFNNTLIPNAKKEQAKATKQKIADADMQYIINLPEIKKNKALKYLKNLPQQITIQALDHYIKEYRDPRKLDLTTTELAQKNIIINDAFKTMPSDLFREKISEISVYIFSKLTNEILNEIQTYTINHLSKKLVLEPENRVIAILTEKIMDNVSKSFPFKFADEIKSNFIHSINPKIEQTTINSNHLT